MVCLAPPEWSVASSSGRKAGQSEGAGDASGHGQCGCLITWKVTFLGFLFFM